MMEQISGLFIRARRLPPTRLPGTSMSVCRRPSNLLEQSLLLSLRRDCSLFALDCLIANVHFCVVQGEAYVSTAVSFAQQIFQRCSFHCLRTGGDDFDSYCKCGYGHPNPELYLLSATCSYHAWYPIRHRSYHREHERRNLREH